MAVGEGDVRSAEIGGEILSGTSLWKDAWRRLLRNKLAVFGLVVVVIVILASIIGPYIIRWTTGFSYDSIPPDVNLDKSFPPFTAPNGSFSWTHPMGTDDAGRDILARVLIGGDNVMMRIVDVLYSLPYIIIVIVLLSLFGNRSPLGQLALLFIALGAVSWLTMARIVRGQIISLKNQEFVLAAKATGVSTTKIIFRHLVPNTLGPVIVYATLTIPSVMLTEAFLSFLGLGVQAPLASWGSLSSDGIKNIAIFPWQLIFPGVTMALTLFSLNFLGDGLRDALDPQMRKV
ncbi:MAG: peptide ABC transporter permease [Acidobacteria bacterium 13_1_20CM_3_53_8]|nr:MAG: peptide ABC transporter permease [Acidobacteria bacterium 13_1_20CM_3_53_8]